MKYDLSTIAANMIHASNTCRSVDIGGGLFNKDELREAAEAIKVFPELLDALSNLVEWHEMLGNNSQSQPVFLARAAIDKATGSQS